LPQPVALSMLPRQADPVLRFFETCRAYRQHEDHTRRWLVSFMSRGSGGGGGGWPKGPCAVPNVLYRQHQDHTRRWLMSLTRLLGCGDKEWMVEGGGEFYHTRWWLVSLTRGGGYWVCVRYQRVFGSLRFCVGSHTHRESCGYRVCVRPGGGGR
jgi:hypothetical protein